MLRPGLFPLFVMLAAGAGACGAPDPAQSTGGASGNGLVVVNSDYQSSSVSLVGFDGTVLSPLVVHSGSTAPGLSAALSGDVVVPTQRVPGGELVLIDRSNGVLSWVDQQTAEVRAQLAVATGFYANPRDYVVMGDGRALVPRYEANPNPGSEAFDAGNDVLVVDPEAPAIVGRIDLTPAVEGSAVLPRAERVVRVGDSAIVLLGAISRDFTRTEPSRLVQLSASGQIEQVLLLDGLYGCGALALSPGEVELGVACSGKWLSKTSSVSTIEESGVARVSLGAKLELEEIHWARDFQQGPISHSIGYARTGTLVFTTNGSDEPPVRDDTFIELDLETGLHRVVQRSSELPFTLGQTRCSSDACFLPDAEQALLWRYPVGEGGLAQGQAIHVDRETGLPPRYLGIF